MECGLAAGRMSMALALEKRHVTVFIGKVGKRGKTWSICCMQLLERNESMYNIQMLDLFVMPCDKRRLSVQFPRCDALENNSSGDGPQCVSLK